MCSCVADLIAALQNGLQATNVVMLTDDILGKDELDTRLSESVAQFAIFQYIECRIEIDWLPVTCDSHVFQCLSFQ